MFGRLFRWGGTRAYARGIEAYNEGRLREALLSFEQVLERHRDPRHPDVTLASFYRAEAHRRLASHALEREEPRQALEHLEAALEVHPGYPDLHLRRGLALLEVGDALAAGEAAGQALECNPDFVEAGLLAVLALGAQGESRRMETVRVRWEAIARARGHALAAVLAHPNPPAVSLRNHLLEAHRRRERVALADAYLGQGLHAEARHVLEGLVVESPTYPDLRVRLATAELALGNAPSARTHVDAALQANPGFDEARLLAAILNVVELDFGRAERSLDALVQRERVGRSARFARAIVHFLLGEPARARRDLEVLENVQAHAVELLELRAALEASLGNLTLARDHFAQLLDSSAGAERAVDAVALASALGDPTLASRGRRCLAASDRGVSEMLARAETFRLEGEIESALDLLEQASADHPRDPALLFALGRLRVGEGQFTAGARRLGQAQAMAPPAAELRLLRAQALRRDGSWEEADRVLEARSEDAWPVREEALEQLYLWRRTGRGAEAEELQEERGRLVRLDFQWSMQRTSRWWALLIPGAAGSSRRSKSSGSLGEESPREPATPRDG